MLMFGFALALIKYLSANYVLVGVNIVQRVVIVLLHRAQRLLSAPPNTVQ